MQVIATKNKMKSFLKHFLIAFIMVFFVNFLNGQNNTFVRSKIFYIDSSVIKLDTLSVIPGSLLIEGVDPSLYQLNCIDATIHILDSNLMGKNLFCTYKVINIDFSKKYFHKSDQIVTQKGVVYTPQILNISNSWLNSYHEEVHLESNGAITRGFSVGNNQDFVLNSALNLQLKGFLAPDIEIKANITDKNVPIQPEGNTQNIQEFDKIFITIDYKKKWQLQAGDIEIESPKSHFLILSKKVLGMQISTQNPINLKSTLSNTVGGGVSKGKYYRQKLQITNGRQGPYKLTGNLPNATIVILSGSERVFVDNQLLTRGLDNDYTIDYNIGEITFTSKIMITSEKEIHVEYEYSDLSYAKYTLFSFNEFKSEKNAKWSLRVHFFHEQDLPNRSIQPTLTDSMKLFMSHLNNETLALYPSVDTSSFYPNEILYIKKDTLVNEVQFEIYEHTVQQNGSLFRLSFSYVGQNKGNYKLLSSGSNGRVFYWIAPIQDSPQGDYEPVIQIQTPQRVQVGTIGADYQISKSLKFSSEFAFSNSDKNLFSTLDNKNNAGFAYNFNLAHHKTFLKKDTTQKSWVSSSFLGYEYIHRNFKQVESHRNVEFSKDYNLQNVDLISSGQHLFTLNSKLSNDTFGEIQIQSNVYTIEKQMFAFRNMLTTSLKWRSLQFKTNTSFLVNNDSIIQSDYLRSLNQISKSFKRFDIGFSERFELNRFKHVPTDTFVANSFKYQEAAIFLKNSDSTHYTYLFQVKNVISEKVSKNQFYTNEIANEAHSSFEFTPFRNNILKGTATFRNNHLYDTLGSSFEENFFLAGINYNASFFKNFITLSSFYEAGSGMEQKKIFTFIKIATGQGTHVWFDYNQNGVEEINEFEISAFQNEANYVQVWITSNEYMNTFNTQFYQSIQIRPAQLWKNKTGILKFFSRFQNSAVLRMNQKNTHKNFESAINPFNIDYKDTSIVHSQVNITNHLSFNNQSQIWGMEYFFKLNQTKNVVYYGPEGVNYKSHEFLIKGRPQKKLLLKLSYTISQKNLFSDYFESKNYILNSNMIKSEMQFIFSNTFHMNLTYIFKDKINKLGIEKVKSNEIELDLNYRIVQKGVLQLKLKYANIQENMTILDNLGYDMLEGQSNGNNGICTLSYQTQINDYLIVDFQYNGRVSETQKTVHNGSLQLKVLF